MKKQPATWINYWDRDTHFRTMMKNMTQYFFTRSKDVLHYNKNDVVLDIGCGPGFLEDCLYPEVHEIHGVDTSPRMIAECRHRFGETGNVYFHHLDSSNYTDLSFLEDHEFTLAVCLSVVQYYRQIEDIEKLIRSVQQISAPGARLLIADIPVQNNTLLDGFNLLRGAAAEGLMGQTIRFLFKTMRSEYRHIRAARGLLCFPVSRLREILAPFDAKWVETPLTFNHRRVNLLIRIDS
jgi:ubiquinone/menaquinone biosynthesis C-methylase UbiE